MTSALGGQRKSTPYIPSWPLLPPEDPCVRFCHHVWNVTNEPTIEYIQQEKKRVITLWNELKEENKNVYYREYEEDLNTYSRLQMMICGCHTCKEAISKQQGVIDVTHFISKLKHNKIKNNGNQCTMQINPQSIKHVPSCDVADIITSNFSDSNSEPTDKLQQTFSSEKNCFKLIEKNYEKPYVRSKASDVQVISPTGDLEQELLSKTNSFKSSNSFCLDTPHESFMQVKEFPDVFLPIVHSSDRRKCTDDYLLMKSKQITTEVIDVSNDLCCKDSSINVAKRGYPFTTSNCMDFSGDESDLLDEICYREGPSTFLSADRSSPSIQVGQVRSSPSIQDSLAIFNSCHPTAGTESSYNVPSTEEYSTPECSSDSTLSAIAESSFIYNIETSMNDVPSSNFIPCLPLSDDLSERSKQSINENVDLQTSKITFLEIKKICIEMIFKKLQFFKSLRMETELDGTIPKRSNCDEISDDNNLNSCLPEFVPIRNSLRRCTWELLIENEARKRYNRKVTLKLNWTSKGGEPIQCVDSKGVQLDVQSMQPFVRLMPLKSLKTPIVLQTRVSNIFSRMHRRKANFMSKRRLHNKKEQTLDGPVVCNVCNLGFVEQKALIMHRALCNKIQLRREKSPKPVFECLSLNFPLDSEDTADTNVAQNCTVCASSFTDHILREIHMFIFHKANICCTICGMNIRNNASYLAHIVDHQKLQCVICKELYKTNEQLNQHLTFDHLEFELYCHKCDKMLPSIFLYQVHMLGHLAIRPFVCSVCTKRFKRKYNLVGHLWIHKPHGYKCADCRLTFPRPHLLNRHIRIFHGLLGID